MKFTQEQKTNVLGACKDLRENPKKTQRTMKTYDGGRCCLCVMEDYMINQSDGELDLLKVTQEQRDLPETECFGAFFGPVMDIELHCPIDDTFALTTGPAGINDHSSTDITHTRIAELLENYVNDPENIV